MKLVLLASYASIATSFRPLSATVRPLTAARMSAVATSVNAPVAKKEWMTPIKVGDTIPNVVFKTRTRIDSDVENPFDWKDLTSEDLFKGKRIVLFSLPGAFTPTCSTTHLPGYEKAYEEMTQKLGVDDVYCLSVNDAFVMRQWGLHQGLAEDKTPGKLGFQKVKLLPDGACHFTRGMGMSCMWDTERGFGERSWRYSAVINDMKIEQLFIEAGANIQNSGPDPFEVSDAQTMLSYLRK
jgi:peroxiredoxin